MRAILASARATARLPASCSRRVRSDRAAPRDGILLSGIGLLRDGSAFPCCISPIRWRTFARSFASVSPLVRWPIARTVFEQLFDCQGSTGMFLELRGELRKSLQRRRYPLRDRFGRLPGLLGPAAAAFDDPPHLLCHCELGRGARIGLHPRQGLVHRGIGERKLALCGIGFGALGAPGALGVEPRLDLFINGRMNMARVGPVNDFFMQAFSNTSSCLVHFSYC